MSNIFASETQRVNKVPALWVQLLLEIWQPENIYFKLLENALQSMQLKVLLINKVHMHWSLWGFSHLGLAKIVNCNQILGHVVDEDYIEFID